MKRKRPTVRPRFLGLVGVSGVLLAASIATLALSDSTMMRALAVFTASTCWLVPTFYAVRYHSRLSVVDRVTGGDIQRSQRSVTAKLDELRAKESRHEYLQERALDRIEDALRGLHLRSIVTPLPFSSSGVDILFVTSNGAGLGHLSRLLAIAGKLVESTSCEFLTLSSAYKRVATFGYKINYFPSADTVGEHPATWNPVFREYFHQLVQNVRPRVVVFDGTWVYTGVSEICRGLLIPLVWVQRGTWKAEIDEVSVQRHNAKKVADYVVIPGDYAGTEPVDAGTDIEPHYVGPIVMTPRSGLLCREDACVALGLDPSKRHVLISLGSELLGDGEIGSAETIAAVRRFAPDLLPVQVISPLTRNRVSATDVISISSYPVMVYASAFDAMVSASGYNSTQEAISLGLPTLFVPNLNTLTDDQYARASVLAAEGLCLCATTIEELNECMQVLADEEARQMISTKLDKVPAPNGAVESARIIEGVIARSRWRRELHSVQERRT